LSGWTTVHTGIHLHTIHTDTWTFASFSCSSLCLHFPSFYRSWTFSFTHWACPTGTPQCTPWILPALTVCLTPPLPFLDTVSSFVAWTFCWTLDYASFAVYCTVCCCTSAHFTFCWLRIRLRSCFSSGYRAWLPTGFTVSFYATFPRLRCLGLAWFLALLCRGFTHTVLVWLPRSWLHRPAGLFHCYWFGLFLFHHSAMPFSRAHTTSIFSFTLFILFISHSSFHFSSWDTISLCTLLSYWTLHTARFLFVISRAACTSLHWTLFGRFHHGCAPHPLFTSRFPLAPLVAFTHCAVPPAALTTYGFYSPAGCIPAWFCCALHHRIFTRWLPRLCRTSLFTYRTFWVYSLQFTSLRTFRGCILLARCTHTLILAGLTPSCTLFFSRSCVGSLTLLVFLRCLLNIKCLTLHLFIFAPLLFLVISHGPVLSHGHSVHCAKRLCTCTRSPDTMHSLTFHTWFSPAFTTATALHTHYHARCTPFSCYSLVASVLRSNCVVFHVPLDTPHMGHTGSPPVHSHRPLFFLCLPFTTAAHFLYLGCASFCSLVTGTSSCRSLRLRTYFSHIFLTTITTSHHQDGFTPHLFLQFSIAWSAWFAIHRSSCTLVDRTISTFAHHTFARLHAFLISLRFYYTFAGCLTLFHLHILVLSFITFSLSSFLLV